MALSSVDALGSDCLEPRHFHAKRGIGLEMPSLHARPEERTHHIMDVIDRFRRVACLGQMHHVRLDDGVVTSHTGKSPKSWKQVFLPAVTMILLR
jgi:hypothetical protein